MNLLSKLDGFKTYLLCALTVLYVLYGVYLGEPVNVELLSTALVGAGLRDGIAKL